LARMVDGRPAVYFDAPGGTQVCDAAIDAMAAHLAGGTANSGGAFATSIETDRASANAHEAIADLLGAQPDEIAFGPNMTSLTLAVSRALSRDWSAGDEIVLTRLDHDANVAPWLHVADDRGMTVRWLDFDLETGRWAVDDLKPLLNARTRLVALGIASNALGTLNPVAEAVAVIRAHCDALIYLDAVQSVPHLLTDVVALGADFLACSPYKFFGPHQGVLCMRNADRVHAYKVRPAEDHGAHRLETGTPSFEGQAGTGATIGYLEWLGATANPSANSRRARIEAAMAATLAYEHMLGTRMLAGLRTVSGLKLWGPPTMAGRVPTFAFTIDGHHPDAIAAALAARGIFAWSGHFYAVEVIERLGLAATGGLVRVGLCHYNTVDEVDRLIDALKAL
jgi:cysteine desulfurase family protein (TIGR01976 family)